MEDCDRWPGPKTLDDGWGLEAMFQGSRFAPSIPGISLPSFAEDHTNGDDLFIGAIFYILYGVIIPRKCVHSE